MYTVRRIVDRSAFIRWTRTLRGPETSPASASLIGDSLVYPRRVDPEEFERNVCEMAHFCRLHGARFLALTRQHAKFSRGVDLYNERLRRLEGQGILVLIDIRDIYPTAVQDTIMWRYPEDTVHFNEKGYGIVAERTARRVMEEGWLDESSSYSKSPP